MTPRNETAADYSLLIAGLIRQTSLEASIFSIRAEALPEESKPNIRAGLRV
jgi:hypothetical protein